MHLSMKDFYWYQKHAPQPEQWKHDGNCFTALQNAICNNKIIKIIMPWYAIHITRTGRREKQLPRKSRQRRWINTLHTVSLSSVGDFDHCVRCDMLIRQGKVVLHRERPVRDVFCGLENFDPRLMNRVRPCARSHLVCRDQEMLANAECRFVQLFVRPISWRWGLLTANYVLTERVGVS